MSSAPVLPDSPELIDASSDPGAFVVAALSRAKTWLEQATTVDLPEVAEAKARAEAIRCYVAQKDIGKDAELAATEIVRRAERRIGELIREGQDNGEIRRKGQGAKDTSQPPDEIRRLSPTEFASEGELNGNGAGIYAMTDDVSGEEFEEALDEAKSERNLSRRNLVGKIRDGKERRAEGQRDKQPRAVRAEQIRELAATGRTSQQIAAALGVGPEHVRRLAAAEGIVLRADEVIGRARRIDSNRVVGETVSMLENLVSAIDLVEFEELDRESLEGWVRSLRRSLRSLQRFTKELST